MRFHRDVIATCGNAAFDEVVRTFAPRLARLIHAATGGSVDAARRRGRARPRPGRTRRRRRRVRGPP
ncbi:hypothetical protein MICRO80W_140094 [Micrococcus luteus]|nr:hypothetical protein MICRO80W_140094 [Micrococcus luteus]